MSRLVFLFIAAVSFFYFYHFFQRMQRQLTAPPSIPQQWSTSLKSYCDDIISKHPRNLVGPQKALELHNKNEAVFIDVRSTQEQNISVIPGAIQVQPGTIDTHQAPWKDLSGDKPLIVYCTIGERSAELKDQLKKKGWSAFNLVGGICAWTWVSGPLVNQQGQETTDVHVWSSDYADCLATGYQPVIEQN